MGHFKTALGLLDFYAQDPDEKLRRGGGREREREREKERERERERERKRERVEDNEGD